MKITNSGNTLREAWDCQASRMGPRGTFLLLYGEACPESALIMCSACQFFSNLSFMSTIKIHLKSKRTPWSLKSTLLCLAFHGLECHLLPPVNKANINTLPCLLFFMHSIFFTWQSGHLKGNYGSDLCPGKGNCLYNI